MRHTPCRLKPNSWNGRNNPPKCHISSSSSSTMSLSLAIEPQTASEGMTDRLMRRLVQFIDTVKHNNCSHLTQWHLLYFPSRDSNARWDIRDIESLEKTCLKEITPHTQEGTVTKPVLLYLSKNVFKNGSTAKPNTSYLNCICTALGIFGISVIIKESNNTCDRNVCLGTVTCYWHICKVRRMR